MSYKNCLKNYLKNMPELPEVKTVIDQLKNEMLNRKLKNIKVYPSSRYYPDGVPGGDYVTTNMHENQEYIIYDFNGEIIDIYSKGKVIFMEVIVKIEGTDFNIILISHMMMEGHYTFKQPKFNSIVYELCKYVGIFRKESESNYVYFNCSDNKTYLKIIALDSEYNDIIKNIGPDYLSGEINLITFLERCHSSRMSNVSVCAFLINQKWFSGIGNYLKSEILFVAKISPHRILGTLNTEEATILYKSILEVINESYSKGGCTLYTYIQPNGFKGEYEVKVYNRHKDPNGNSVISDLINGKKTYWSPSVQK